MKTVTPFVLFVFFLSFQLFGQADSKNHIILNSQYKVDHFPVNYPNMSVVEDRISVEGEDITNIDSLAQITTILDAIYILDCPNLNNISGLMNLRDAGYVFISGIPKLVRLDGLHNLENLGGIHLESCDSLSDLSALDHLTKIGSISLRDLNSLGNLDVFENLNKLDYFTLGYDPNLTNFEGFSQIDSIINILIYYNPKLVSLHGFESLKYVEHDLQIFSNPALSNIAIDSLLSARIINIENNDSLVILQGFSNLRDVRESLRIRENAILREITGFTNLEKVSYLTIYENDSLQTLGLFNNLDSVGAINISDNMALRDLSGFQSLKSISSSLEISTNKNLETISGFNSLTSIGTDFTLRQNLKLKNISGLQNLQSIGMDIDCYGNIEMTSFSSLRNLSYVGNDIWINSNYKLESFDGFQGLEQVNGDLKLEVNKTVTSLNGLENLRDVDGDFLLKSCFVLPNIQGLDNLTSVGGNFILENNYELTSLEGLGNLASVGGSFSFKYNKKLKSFEELTNIRSLGSLGIENQDSTQNFLGFDKIESLNHLSVSSCKSLKNLIGFQNLKTIQGNLWIYNSYIEDLTHLSNLKYVNRIYIQNADRLRSLNGLENVETVDAIDIRNNEILDNLSGLRNANPDGISTVEIVGNESLSDCAIWSFCQTPYDDFYTYFNISNNMEGCNSREEMFSACETNGTLSQTAFPLIHTDPYWSVLRRLLQLPNINKTEKFSYIDDFVFCGQRYSKIVYSDANQRLYLRSDLDKTYFKRGESCSDKEYLMYDYSMELGDTAWVGWNQNHHYALDTAAFVLTQIDSILLNNQYHKKFHLVPADASIGYSGALNWVQGVGALEHPFYPLAKLTDSLNYHYELLCHDSAGLEIYHNPTFSECYYNYVAVDEMEMADFQVSPNPFNEKIIVKSPTEPIENISMVSTTGSSVPLSWYMEGDEVQIIFNDFMPKGVYLLTISSKQFRKTFKMIKSGE